MSSRILSGDKAQPAEPIVWNRIAKSGGRDISSPEQARDATAEENHALRARVAELEREVQVREQNALKTGFEKGRAAGEQEAAGRINPAIERFAQTVAELSARRKQMRHDAEKDVVKLAIAIARRVLHRELSIDLDAMLGIVKAALAQVDTREIEKVRVNPADAASVKASIERLRPGAQFEVASDQTLERGAAVFETTRGSLDTSIETQLGEIERGLVDRLRS